MAVPFSNTTLRAPHGFANLLEGLAREVLRHQPKDIYGFAEKYFEELLQRRKETGVEDLAQLGAALDDRYYNNRAYCDENLNTSNPKQQEAAIKIQSEYRRHLASKKVNELRREQAAVHIQSNFRGYRIRKSLGAKSPKPDVSVAPQEQTEDLPVESIAGSLEQPEISPADRTRSPEQHPLPAEEHSLDEVSESNQAGHSIVEDTGDTNKETEAAIKIQAKFRGYLVRKQQKSNDSFDTEEPQSEADILVDFTEEPSVHSGDQTRVSEELEDSTTELETQRESSTPVGVQPVETITELTEPEQSQNTPLDRISPLEQPTTEAQSQPSADSLIESSEQEPEKPAPKEVEPDSKDQEETKT
ncbi:unnamed protein product [Calicophoron daubneyi]|uniref:RIIa domain-containing protein n=1 Tax=Calicophoron daubneyi TaxID=300641 RepID=A0AAV2TVH8_CALDB